MIKFTPLPSKPVLVFGGPYSNLQATRALQQVADELKIPTSNILCTGDLVAYCAQPEETINLIREWEIAVVAGNCEEAIGNDAEDCGCGFEEGTTCDLLSAQWFNYTLPRVSPANKQWMRELPERIRFSYHGRQFLAIHGGITGNNQFIFSSTPESEKNAQLLQVETDIIVAGHCGLPFGTPLEAGYWLNAGVIGMPANDGNNQTWYMLISPEPEQLKVSWHRLTYPVHEASEHMLRAGLDNGYRLALEKGIWPSMDVLPDTERNNCGQPLSPYPLSVPITPVPITE